MVKRSSKHSTLPLMVSFHLAIGLNNRTVLKTLRRRVSNASPNQTVHSKTLLDTLHLAIHSKNPKRQSRHTSSSNFIHCKTLLETQQSQHLDTIAIECEIRDRTQRDICTALVELTSRKPTSNGIVVITA
uniref:Uncharacterized protein n=2 Tax=Cacopsylla melanoneura TaxID=428564 RepID=A0A8D8TEC7_9HEMI